jgi:small nuclear ribonucleoprotein (snRNP)-like protein
MKQPTLNPSPASSPAILAITDTLGSFYRVKIKDGRSFVGQLVAVDGDGNLVLDNTIESSTPANVRGEEGENEREVGLVLLKKKWWVSVELESD